MSSFLKYVRYALVIVLVAALIIVGYELGSRKGSQKIEELTLKLAQNESTVEVQKGLYATTLVQLSGLEALLSTNRDEIKALKKWLEDSDAQLLASQQLVVKWKKAYEGAIGATQTTDPPATPGSAERQRVSFSGLLGPIQVDGYTLTDPAEAHVKIAQTKPLILTVSVAKNPDGTWTSYTTSSDENIDVQVSLGGVDPGIMTLGWRQRVWLNAGVNVLGDRSAYVGLSYSWDRFSLGARCGTAGNCGIDAGFRIFK